MTLAVLTEALLVAALTVPRPYGDTESTHARAERLAVIAEAIALESWSVSGWRWGTEDLAWLLFATTAEESGGFRLDVHDGRRTGDHSRARCLAQLHVSALLPRAEWLATTGTNAEATRTCMRAAARAYVAASACVGQPGPLNQWSVARLAANYGTGRTCSPNGLKFATSRALKWFELGSGYVGLRVETGF